MNHSITPLSLQVFSIKLCVLALVLVAHTVSAAPPETSTSFTNLFDGRSLDGWDGDPRFWRVEEGMIVGETTQGNGPKRNTFLIHRGGEFGDFELRLSYQVEGYNSGVQYRSVDKGDWSVAGYQCDFEARWHPSKKNKKAAPVDKFSGMFFEEGGRMFMGQRGEFVIVRTNPKKAKKPQIERIGSVGDPAELETHIHRDGWNELVVIAQGNHFIHMINGHVMAVGIDEDKANRRDSGIFAFQLHKGPPMKIQLKNIRVRRLSGSEPALVDVSRENSQSTDSMIPTTAGDTPHSDYEQHALKNPGNPANGKRLFADQRTKCNICHKVAGSGGDVGKDLSSIGGKFNRPHLIESLLEPSRQIVEGYQTTNVLLIDGRVLSGIVKSQDSTKITIADASGKLKSVRLADIEEQNTSALSYMPDGIEKLLSLDEFTDLIAYLESLGTGNVKRGGNLKGALSIPDGFDVDVVATGLDGLTALEVLPDGRVLICEQPGRVRVIENGELLPEPFITLPVDSFWERGVIGITHDPDFPKKPFIYVCSVAKEPYPHHHVSRFVMKGNVAVPHSEKLLLVGDDQTKMGGKVPAGHQGGALHFGPDKKLYISIGEQTSGAPAQSLDTFLGKILRINSDGSIPSDNPFISKTTGKYQAIWAYGCRNPFTFAFRKTDGLMLINDVGGKSEEINVGRRGANYGWPVVDHGNFPEYKTPKFDGPIHWYAPSSLNGGDFCPITTATPQTGDRKSEVQAKPWPRAWQGKYFFADFQHGWIKTLDPNNGNQVDSFLSGIRQPVDLRFAPDGSLYVLLRNAWVIDNKFANGTGSVLKISPSEVTKKAKPKKLTRKTPTKGLSRIPENLPSGKVVLTEDTVDASAGGLPAFKIATPTATYFLEKRGGGLSSLLDKEGNDWLGFHPRAGSRAGGEYRGFPNAVHRQDGSYFHPLNAHTDPMKTRVEHRSNRYVSIIAESSNGKWRGRYEFFATHCTFTILKMPPDKKYWVLYEGTPGGELDRDDWWMTSSIKTPQLVAKRHNEDIPSPEWMAFGDQRSSRSIVLLNHRDDEYPDSFYAKDQEMTVFGFGRGVGTQRLTAYQNEIGKRFSIGLVESSSHSDLSSFVDRISK